MEPIGTQINVRLKTVHNGENYYLSVGDVNGVRLVTEAERNTTEDNCITDQCHGMSYILISLDYLHCLQNCRVIILINIVIYIYLALYCHN